MRSAITFLVCAILFAPAALAQFPADLQLSYATYAAGLQVVAVKADVALGPSQYRIGVRYHTTGLMGFFNHTRQHTLVEGAWHADAPVPRQYISKGVRDGTHRATVIDYRNGAPLIRTLVPRDRPKRQAVPPSLQAHSMDTLSAIVLLIRQVTRTRTCNAAVRVFDGHSVSKLKAHTVEWEKLPHTSRSAYSGVALRCDFTSRTVAGFKVGTDHRHHHPLHGSIWFASLVPGGPAVPVRLQFHTKWFGDATTYLTAAAAQPPTVVAQQH